MLSDNVKAGDVVYYKDQPFPYTVTEPDIGIDHDDNQICRIRRGVLKYVAFTADLRPCPEVPPEVTERAKAIPHDQAVRKCLHDLDERVEKLQVALCGRIPAGTGILGLKKDIEEKAEYFNERIREVETGQSDVNYDYDRIIKLGVQLEKDVQQAKQWNVAFEGLTHRLATVETLTLRLLSKCTERFDDIEERIAALGPNNHGGPGTVEATLPPAGTAEAEEDVADPLVRTLGRGSGDDSPA